MALNFNTFPYFDDFDPAKNFHRILFKPGNAVQARELTQTQSIFQDQITKFADHIFKQNSAVTGGQITTNLNCSYIKLQSTYNGIRVDVNDWSGKLIQNATGTILARVLAVAPITSADGTGDPDTLILTYKSGIQFTDGDIIYDTESNLIAQLLLVGATGTSSVSSIAQGVFYISSNTTKDTGEIISNGTFVQVNPQTTILGKYSNAPSVRVGLNISESIESYIEDPSLLDPAIGASNYQAPGADRYVISLNLETRPLTLGDDSSFIELVRIENGKVFKMTDDSVYSVIGDYFAKRDYETNGDYVVSDFKLTPKVNTDASKYTLSVGKGIAYVHGYRVETQYPIDIVSNRARTTESQNNNPVFMDFGSYLYVNSVGGANTSFFDVTTSQQIDLHCVDRNYVNTSSANTYNSTLVASAYIRGLVYDHSTTDANTASYVYKAYINDVQNNVISANVVSANANTITLPSYFSATTNAYNNIIVTIQSGTGAGQFRTISAYNGTSKVANISQNWTTVPNANSIFGLLFDIKDTESLIAATKTSYPASIVGKASIDDQSKNGGVTNGDVSIQNPTIPEMLWRVGNPYVANVVNSSYTTLQTFRSIAFTTTGSGVSAQLNYEGGYTDIIRHFGTPLSTLSTDLVKQNYTVVVTNKGANASINVGDVIPWVTAGRTVTLDTDASIATFNASDLTPFTATIVAKVFVVNGDNTGYILKGKNKIVANTTTVNISGTQVNTYTYVDDTPLTSKGQVYIRNAGIVSPGQSQSLYLSDVKFIRKVIDTGSANTTPTVAMLTDVSYDITNRFTLDNGQRDNFYDHASIKLIPGAQKPQGNILVLVDYYQHVGGDGYFNVKSYIHTGVSSLPEDYRLIPSYTSKNGTYYNLRDCLDFRPARLNAQTASIFRYSNSSDTRHGFYQPVDSTIYTSDYSYYLGRKDLLVITKDRNVTIIEGSPSVTPLLPTQPDASLVVAQISHLPYTSFIPTETSPYSYFDLSFNKVLHKRYTMQDISGLESRISQMEYYTSLNNLEKNAQSMQISDTFGLNRFKNGIMTDDFSSYATSDAYNLTYFATINKRTKQMTSSQIVDNYPLKSLDTIYNTGIADPNSQNNLQYAVHKSGYVNYYTLPHTSNTAIVQYLASRVVNLNPFSVPNFEGSLSLSPNVDNWVDRNELPALLITDKNLNVFRASDNYSTFYMGDWQTVSSTSEVLVKVSSTDQQIFGLQNHTDANWWVDAPVFEGRESNIGVGLALHQVTDTETSTLTTITNQQQQVVSGYYSNIGNTYSLNNGYITDISILPYIRAQQLTIKAKSLLINSPMTAFFDGQTVSGNFRKCNVLKLTNVTGKFYEQDTIGYIDSTNQYRATAVVMGVFEQANTVSGSNNTTLYVISDVNSNTYTTNGTIVSLRYYSLPGYAISIIPNTSPGVSSGTLTSTQHFAGTVSDYTGSSIIVNSSVNRIKLSPLASSVDNYYVGNTINLVARTGTTASSTIVSYDGTLKVANLASNITASTGDFYSIGGISTDESGAVYGIFNLPASTFHTGERVFRIDNSINGNKDTTTSYAEGTFYASGLSVQSQQIDFGASPSGAKNTQTSYNNRQIVETSVSQTQNKWLYTCPYDPVAQTFIIDNNNFPNGMFLSSVKLFFRTKPTVDNSPVTLSIVGTLNGYPNGQTLDNSIVTVSKNDIKISENPHYLDPNSYTVFNFEVPVYIQPGVLYSLIMKSTSKEYNLWTAALNDTALLSSVKNNYTDPNPTTATKITTAPYVGSLFISQNSQTWTADQNQSLMFVIDRCQFDISVSPTIQYVIPRYLPQRTLVDQSLDYYNNANNVSSLIPSLSYNDDYADAFNLTTTDFVPSSTNINYYYSAMLSDTSMTAPTSVNPAKYATSMYDNIYLNDGRGSRILSANSNTSFSMYGQISSNDVAVSPLISDAGLTAYTIKWNINNCELSNSLITLTGSGSGYTPANTFVTVSAPTGSYAQQAYAAANVDNNGVVSSVYFTNVGSGYNQTPTITITDISGTPGNGATAIVTGETSKGGGPAETRYLSKKVVLAEGFDSGDLVVYLTAYRPVNTDIYVYYKLLSRNDTQLFDDSSWQLMTMTMSGSTVFSQTRSETYEYTFSPGTSGTAQGYATYTSTNGKTYNTFSQFAIKVVTVSTDSTYVPYLTDIRAIAMPSNVITPTVF